MQAGRIQQVHRQFPMREDFTELCCEKGVAPVAIEIAGCQRDDSPAVIAQRDREELAEGRVKMDGRGDTLDKPWNVEFRAENHIGVAQRAIPKEEDKFVLKKAGKRALLGDTNDLSELCGTRFTGFIGGDPSFCRKNAF